MEMHYISWIVLLFLFSALWINVPGLTALVTVCSLCGMVIYAQYKDCDPIKHKDIDKSDQVRQVLLNRVRLHYIGQFFSKKSREI